MQDHRSRTFALALALAVPMLVGSAVSASAATSDPGASAGAAQVLDANGVGPTLDLGGPTPVGQARKAPTVGRMSALAVAFSPAGCTGTTDYPHISGSEASVHGHTQCNVIVGEAYVSTTLKRDRWYGEETLATGVDDRVGTNGVEATPHWVCYGTGTYSYRGYSSHKSIESSGTYTLSTSNWQLPGISRFTC
jgi:hypothetical protein